MNEFERLSRMAPYYKELFPPGTRIYLEQMEDPYCPVPSGTRGTVDLVDDLGQIHMTWDNGRTLALVPQADHFRKLTLQELEDEKKKDSLSAKIQNAQQKGVNQVSSQPAKTNDFEADR